jgi:hypothetical protein
MAAALLSRLRDQDGSEVFSQFTEDLWRGLHGFRWECPACALAAMQRGEHRDRKIRSTWFSLPRAAAAQVGGA